MNEISQTQESYSRVAQSYAEHWHEQQADLAEQLDQFASYLPPNSLVADIGCGPGFFMAQLQQRGLRAVGLDLSLAMMQAGRAYHTDLSFAQADMRQLPLAANSVAGIWACASLLHLPRTAVSTTLTAFNQILQPNGILFISVKQGDGAAWATTAYGHTAKRFFTYWQPEQLTNDLKTADFTPLTHSQNKINQTTWLNQFAQK